MWTVARNRMSARGKKLEGSDYIIFVIIHHSTPLLPMATATIQNLHEVTSSDHFKGLLSEDLQRISLLYFWAPWAAPCKQMTEVVAELSRKHQELLILKIEAEEQSDISDSFEVENVPAFVILRVLHAFPSISLNRSTQILLPSPQGHTLLARINGADARALTEAIAKHLRSSDSTTPLSHSDKSPAHPLAVEKTETPEELEQRLRGLMKQSKVVLFMKGSPGAPRCGFSRKICSLLGDNKVEYSHFDILTDESVRQGELVLLMYFLPLWIKNPSPQVSRSSMTGPPFHSLSSMANLSVGLTSPKKWLRTVSSRK